MFTEPQSITGRESGDCLTAPRKLTGLRGPKTREGLVAGLWALLLREHKQPGLLSVLCRTLCKQ